MYIFRIVLYCWPSLMSAITKNHKNGCHFSKIDDRDLQKKPNPTKFGSTNNFDMLSAILDVSHYLKSQKWLPFL